jgi:protein-tyrosine kinase
MNTHLNAQPADDQPSEMDTFVLAEDAIPRSVATVYHEQPIGEILRDSQRLTAEQIQRVLRHQEQGGGRFGDSAIALGLLGADDVLWALARQFRYPYAGSTGNGALHKELFMANEPFSDDVETFRDLRSHLLMTVMAPHERKRALAVVSADIGDGRTFLSANLAAAFSQLPGRTLIVDCDMRLPRLHELFGMDNAKGLSNILSGRAKPNVIRPVQELQNLYMLPVGTVPPNPVELIQSSRFAMLLQELVRKFDYVLLDTPAAAHGSDARLIAARAGAALIVGRRNRTHTKAAQQFVSQLSKASVGIAGMVMNDG